MKTPVLLLVFNRSDQSRMVFEEIRKAKPESLYVASDGPRVGRTGEREKVNNVRDYILKNIDWPCNVKTLFREENLGCGKAVSSAISWFFENVEMGIVLEDDCLPSQDFFSFCEVVLDYYKDNESVWAVSGTNMLTNYPGAHSFVFSYYGGNWGWASWRRAWNHYRYDISKEIRNKKNWKIVQQRMGKKHAKTIQKFMNGILKNPDHTWDFQWLWRRLVGNGLSVVPRVNMISNIGFGTDATHTTSESSIANLIIGNSGSQISFPEEIFPDIKFDRLCYSFSNTDLSWINKIKNKLKKYFKKVNDVL